MLMTHLQDQDVEVDYWRKVLLDNVAVKSFMV